MALDGVGLADTLAKDLKDFTSLIETRYTVVHKLVVVQCDEEETYQDVKSEASGQSEAVFPLASR
eukprot:9412829-Alexandrium_andersonii.AAC.1